MKLQKEKGITLVALVVTIVILLILAGVSINLVLGENGLISNAKETRDKTKQAEANEKGQMDNVSDWISETVNNTKLPQTNETKPYMPGDTFVKVEGTNLANGLTIQDADGNQYVWVEVPVTSVVYPTAGLEITEFTTDDYTKIENDLHTYTATYRNNTDFVDEYYENSNNSAEWYTQEQYNEQKQKMLKSIYQNGGFWVAKYEAGIEINRTSASETIVEKPQSKMDLYPYTYVTIAQAKNIAERVTYTKDEKTYTGSLMFGVQWDLILKFIETKKISEDSDIITKLNLDSILIGNYRNSTYVLNRGKYAIYSNWNLFNTWILFNKATENYVGINSNKLIQSSDGNGILLTTGAVNQNSLMNIYDIAGNVNEWTLEYSSNEQSPCTSRGGYYYNQSSSQPASYRFNIATSCSDVGSGFRITIY